MPAEQSTKYAPSCCQGCGGIFAHRPDCKYFGGGEPSDTPLPPWPEAVSDGLTLPCGKCNTIPPFDWRGDDKTWEQVAPVHMRLGVICLPCFAGMASVLGISLIGLIEEIQFVGEGYTISFRPAYAVDHKSRKRIPVGNRDVL